MPKFYDYYFRVKREGDRVNLSLSEYHPQLPRTADVYLTVYDAQRLAAELTTVVERILGKP